VGVDMAAMIVVVRMGMDMIMVVPVGMPFVVHVIMPVVVIMGMIVPVVMVVMIVVVGALAAFHRRLSAAAHRTHHATSNSLTRRSSPAVI
jgi:hypothetical protein